MATISYGLFAQTDVFKVNDPAGPGAHRSEIAATPDGGFVVVYDSLSNAPIRVRAFDGEGQARSAEIVVNTSVAGSQSFPSVAAAPDGQVGVIFADSSTGSQQIRVRWFSSDLEPLGPESVTPFNGSISAIVRSAAEIAATPDGDFYVIARGISGGVHVSLLDGGSHAPISQTTWVNPRGRSEDQDIAVLASGDPIVMAADFLGGIGRTTRLLSWPPNKVVDALGSENDNVNVVALPDGGYAASYRDSQHSPNGEISLRIFNADGSARSSILLVNEGATAGLHRESAITALPTGHVVVLWRQVDVGILVAIFDSQGERILQNIIISDRDGELPSVATLADGSIAATWDDFLDNDIAARIVDLVRQWTGDGTSEVIQGDGLRDLVFAGAGHDEVHGGGGDDLLLGEAGDDQLFGDDGDDLIDGGPGDDLIDGGAGLDLATYAQALAGVTVSLALDGVVQDTGALGMDTLTGIEDLEGSTFNDVLTGSEGESNLMFGLLGDDHISGLSGDDVLIGDAGADMLFGGAGDDILDGGAGDDTLNGGGGSDDTAGYAGAMAGVTVDLRIVGAQDTIGAGVDTLIGIEDLIGSPFVDALTGDGAKNLLVGGAGSDTLTGLGGNDTLIGGAGGDTLNGGAGINDAADYSDSSKSLSVDLRISGPQTTGWGFDTLVGIENLVGAGLDDSLIGSSANNNLSGGRGDDVLDGRFGRDILDGGAGDDVISGGNGNDVISGGSGDDVMASHGGVNDTADYTGAANGVAVDLRITSAQSTGWGQDTLSGFERIQGSAFSDTLIADAGNNKLFGGSGADVLKGQFGKDVLDGGAGADVMQGGAGADIFVFQFIGGVSPSGDRILDLDADDLIDLSAIEANSGIDLDFIGKAGFSGTAGEIRFGRSGGVTQIKIDVDGDGSLDRFINIENGEFELRETSANSLVLQIDPMAPATGAVVTALAGDDTAPAVEPGQQAMLRAAWIDDPTAAWLL